MVRQVGGLLSLVLVLACSADTPTGVSGSGGVGGILGGSGGSGGSGGGGWGGGGSGGGPPTPPASACWSFGAYRNIVFSWTDTASGTCVRLVLAEDRGRQTGIEVPEPWAVEFAYAFPARCVDGPPGSRVQLWPSTGWIGLSPDSGPYDQPWRISVHVEASFPAGQGVPELIPIDVEHLEILRQASCLR